MGSKEHWKERAKRMERYRDEVAAQRSQALADLDREAQEVDLLRTIVGSMAKEGALAISYRDSCWETESSSGPLTPDLLAAAARAIEHFATHDDRKPGWGSLPSAAPLTAERVARGLGAVPLEALDAEAQERGHVRIAQAAVVGNHRNAATESRRREALDDADVAVTLADAATVVRTVRDDLLNPDRPLSLGALALLLGSVLPRIEYQAGCEAAVYDALHDVVLQRAIADAFAPGGSESSIALEGANRVLNVLRSHLPKLTKETP